MKKGRGGICRRRTREKRKAREDKPVSEVVMEEKGDRRIKEKKG